MSSDRVKCASFVACNQLTAGIADVPDDTYDLVGVQVSVHSREPYVVNTVTGPTLSDVLPSP
jgi:hypothetical protein